ncbi:hypothetical protein LA03_10500 [Burkholderia gladioli]|uniref:hypothetical protein n=1 Tax=Burkholderia gladioli TaxID=28095 RepID=UPI00050E3A73|nr:hypothetical protein [Burkholderia gladioli]KGE10464.1 hypothetical protein LA03_10500 [Burkholderia gladioli]
MSSRLLASDATILAAERGEFLRKWCATIGWNIAQLANRIDATAETIDAWFDGTRQVSGEHWLKVIAQLSSEAASRHDVIMIVADDGASPLAVLTEVCYVDHIVMRDRHTAIVSWMDADPSTGGRAPSHQLFTAGFNAAAVARLGAWGADRSEKGSPEERSEWEVSRHLVRRTLEGHLRRMLFKRMVDVAASIPMERD